MRLPSLRVQGFRVFGFIALVFGAGGGGVVGGLNRVYLEAGTRVLKLLDMLSRRYAVVTSRTRWMTFPGNEPSAYAYEHVHRSCQLSEYSHQTFRLRYNQMRWVESR